MRWSKIGKSFVCPVAYFLRLAGALTGLDYQEGAKLVYNYNDVLEELNLSVVTQQMEMRLAPILPQASGDENESVLLGHLDDEPLHIDDIRRRVSLPIASVSSLLTMLELKGLVKQVGCMHYVRMREAATFYGN